MKKICLQIKKKKRNFGIYASFASSKEGVVISVPIFIFSHSKNIYTGQ